MSGHRSGADISGCDWFQDPVFQRVLAMLNDAGGEARVAGGAVRNALMGLPVGDIDIATTLSPDAVIGRAKKAGFKSIPTGIEHGTVTLVANGHPFEVTTLRVDVATDGRRADVAFGTDWAADAERRDLTMNGLYADAAGTVIDLVGGIGDIKTGTVRFIGDANRRIEEDYLRILRFFRFFAWYGKGRPDADGLRACARQKSGLSKLSAERVWSELKRLLAAPDPSRSMLWMRQSGVLSMVLEESEKWGIDAIPGLLRTEATLGWTADPMVRLMAIVPPDPARMADMAERLRMSKAETRRMIGWAEQENLADTATDTVLKRHLYLGDPTAIVDRIRLRLSALRAKAETDDSALMEAAQVSRLLKVATGWKRPSFPLKGRDLVSRGIEPGPALGKAMADLETVWLESNFVMTKDELLSRLEPLSK